MSEDITCLLSALHLDTFIPKQTTLFYTCQKLALNPDHSPKQDPNYVTFYQSQFDPLS